MLTLDELQAELDRITYKPGVKFVLYPHAFEGIWLSVIAEYPDADHPGRTRVNNMRTAVPPIPDADYFAVWLLHRIIRIEAHEAREFLRRDGIKISDPHAPDANE